MEGLRSKSEQSSQRVFLKHREEEGQCSVSSFSHRHLLLGHLQRSGLHQQRRPEEDVQRLVPVGGAGEDDHRLAQELLLRAGGAVRLLGSFRAQFKILTSPRCSERLEETTSDGLIWSEGENNDPL
ncbi:hypothetical protein EYF80_040659 [Liparis tanakae]|uniref:Uncharacterized protein n=1 Tax=Liparis tanakae TaxID=230148 RepID=A0A4Z2G6C0_9TELE|nr:hypothetical protein EYF80_040659 [Liparis tanakae]